MRLRRRLASLLLVGAAFAVGGAQGRDACPDGREDLQGRNLIEHEAWLAQRSARCSNDAAFLAWHGAILNQIGRYDLALVQLERALLLDPGLMSARMDYAEALAATGEREAARNLLQDVLAQPDIPPAAAARIQAALQSLNSYINGFLKETGINATVRIGYDSNLNLAPRLNSLVLTAPGGGVVLPLDPTSQARGGLSQRLEVEGYWAHVGESGKIYQFIGELNHRKAPSDDLDYTQIDLSAYIDRAVELAGRPLGLVAATGNLNYGGEEIYRYVRGGFQLEGPAAPCKNLLGAEIEWRYHLRYVDADYYALLAKSTWLCGKERPLLLQWGVGREVGDDNRPGGSAWLLGARVMRSDPLGPGLLESELRYAGRLDDEAYSPLLQNGAELNVHTFNLRMEYRQNLSKDWQALADVEFMQQFSNLELFELNQIVGHLGIRWRW